LPQKHKQLIIFVFHKSIRLKIWLRTTIWTSDVDSDRFKTKLNTQHACKRAEKNKNKTKMLIPLCMNARRVSLSVLFSVVFMCWNLLRRRYFLNAGLSMKLCWKARSHKKVEQRSMSTEIKCDLLFHKAHCASLFFKNLNQLKNLFF
jgi:hypothetical protein